MEQLERDKRELDLEWNDEQLMGISKERFRVIVKKRIENIASKYISEIRYNNSKSKDIPFNGFKTAKYLLSKNLSIGEAQTLFKLRTRMVDVKDNFKNGQKENMWCKTCQIFKETQQHLLDCPTLRSRTKTLVKFEELDHKMIFGTLEEQETFAKSYHIILQARKDLLNQE